MKSPEILPEIWTPYNNRGASAPRPPPPPPTPMGPESIFFSKV